MYDLCLYVTNDGSAGLFSKEADDVYHSALGAASEAYEKFIFPADFKTFLQNHNSIRVLDICFGIGYNSKSFLNFIFQKKIKNSCYIENILSPYNDMIYTDKIFDNKYNVQIHSDKIVNNESDTKYNGQIYNDKVCDKSNRDKSDFSHDKSFDKKIKILIKAIDVDQTLALLAPFINSDLNPNMKNQFKNEKISKFSHKNSKINHFNFLNFLRNTKKHSKSLLPKSFTTYPEAINLFLYDKIVSEYPEIIKSSEFLELLNNKKYKGYFNHKLCRLLKLNNLSGSNLYLIKGLYTFLHNIYYEYLSERYKNDLKCLKTLDIDFSLKINDARQEIQSDNSEYDFIFLDAFTPSKCPCLWTLDFFQLLYKHLSADGVILTYSNAAPVRNAFILAGFQVGKIYNPVENKFTGTIAAKNKSLIKFALSEFDLGLLKTKAGIVYRDENLTDLNEAIINRRNIEIKNSKLISSTKYHKRK